MKRGVTNRGFGIYEFEDRYGEGCSLQESSLATEACVWLGVSNPQILEEGWHPQYSMRTRPAPLERTRGLRVHTRMHLTRQMAADLIPLLQHFVDTGELPGSDDE